jgi:hypothetical protein
MISSNSIHPPSEFCPVEVVSQATIKQHVADQDAHCGRDFSDFYCNLLNESISLMGGEGIQQDLQDYS